ncbi:unnamed protein product [Rhizoctonia solani]|uniref:Uncharacterized protein n=1 Tax=Rhizoctonia solani TaxID=456999 RepID=A0A8H3E0V5_9AGAM|nr:unnamed protein product [Rhizoctonia solani]
MSDECDAHRPYSQQPRRNSLTPSMKRERPMLRSSPLAGTSYSADGAGNVVEHTSALEEEITRRRTGLPGLNGDELARLAALPSSSLSISTYASPNTSRKGSLETTEDPYAPRRARPSFISLSPQGSRPGSRGSLVPPTPTSPTNSPALRERHSSPHLAAAAKPNPPESGPGPANWMTAAPSPSFSRMGVHGSGVVMPVKAFSRAGERIKLKSTPGQPGGDSTRPDAHPGASTKPRSLKSFRSMSRLLLGNDATEHERDVPPMPTSISPPGPRSYASSSESSSPTSPTTPNDSTRSHRQLIPLIADTEPPLFSDGAAATGLAEDQVGPEEKEGAGRMRRLLSKVRKWRTQS